MRAQILTQLLLSAVQKDVDAYRITLEIDDREDILALSIGEAERLFSKKTAAAPGLENENSKDPPQEIFKSTCSRCS